MADLHGKKIAFLATDMVEQVELTEPWNAIVADGGKPELVSLETGEIQGFNHYDKADRFRVDRAVGEVSAEDYDALVRDFAQSGKPMGVICHAPWMLVEADVVRGRTVTSFWSIKTDVKNAGGDWVDEEVVVDGNLVTSRYPKDIPAFNERLVELIERASVGALR
jgi:protease I